MPNKFSERLNDLAEMIDSTQHDEAASRGQSESVASVSTTETGLGAEGKSRSRKGSVTSAAKTFYATHFTMNAKDQEDLSNLLRVLSVTMRQIRRYIRNLPENEGLKFTKNGYYGGSIEILGEIASPFRYSFPPLTFPTLNAAPRSTSEFIFLPKEDVLDAIFDLCSKVMEECEAKQNFDEELILSLLASNGPAYSLLKFASKSVIANQHPAFFNNLMKFKTPPPPPKVQSIPVPPVPKRLSKSDAIGKPPLAPKRGSVTRSTVKAPGPVIPPRPSRESIARAHANSLQAAVKPTSAPKVENRERSNSEPPPIPKRPTKKI